MSELITVGPLCVRLGALEGQIRRLCKREKIPFRTFRGMRVFRVADIPTIRAACVEAGYLKPEPEVTNAR